MLLSKTRFERKISLELALGKVAGLTFFGNLFFAFLPEEEESTSTALLQPLHRQSILQMTRFTAHQ